MAEIAPNSVFKLLRGCPLDSDYTNSLWFASDSAQYSYFSGLTKYTLSNQQYQRHSTGVIRVSIQADDLFDINYCMFQNTAFGNKWFYAFVTDVEYVNNNCTNVYYDIDVLQTYYFDYDTGATLVERETPSSDNIGENVVPENLDIGEYICDGGVNENFDTNTPSGWRVNIMYVPNQVNEQNFQIPNYSGGIYNNIYNAVNIDSMILETAQGINNYLNTLVRDTNATIISVQQIPKAFAIASINSPYSKEINVQQDLSFHEPNSSFTYTPKNNKLHTYPYQYLLVSNNTGKEGIYHWEDFSGSTVSLPQARFTLRGCAAPSAQVSAYPNNYKGLNINYECGITLTDFPECVWSYDSYARWINNNQAMRTAAAQNMALGAVVDIIGTAAAARSKTDMAIGVAQTGINVLQNANQMYAEKKTAIARQDDAYGNLEGSPLRISEGRFGFSFYRMGIKASMARTIDDYFTRFGYATRRLKKPSLRNRQNWTYVKTIGCMIHAKSGTGLNAEAEKKICQIFDNGITFWTNGSIVGEYELTNDFITT